MQHSILARSHNRCCCGNTTMHSVCCLATRQQYKIFSVAQQYFCGKLMSPATIKLTYEGLHVKCPMLHWKNNISLLIAIFGCTISLNGLLSQISRCAVSQFLYVFWMIDIFVIFRWLCSRSDGTYQLWSNKYYLV
jgi:hypothetical protein